jgi:hypothetical protein
MTGALYDAAALERWNVVNRVLPDDGFDEAARDFARRLAEGPTRAHAATKAIVRAQVQGGVRHADARVPELAGDLFATEDLKGAVRSFLEQARATPPTRGAERALAPPDSGGPSRHDPGHAGLAGIAPCTPQPPRGLRRRARPVRVRAGGRHARARRWSRTRRTPVESAPDLTAGAGRAGLRPPGALRADPRRVLAAEGPDRRLGPARLAVRAPVDGDQARRDAAGLPRVRHRARDGETMRGSVFKPQPGEQLAKVGVAIVGRTSDRTMTLRFSQTGGRAPEDDRLHRRGDQARLHPRLVRRYDARGSQDRHLQAPRSS